MRKKRAISICLAMACLLLGSALYFLFRPTSLLMFHWADALGMTKLIYTMRTWANDFDRYLPTWIVYSLPFALWVSSYLFFIKAIWWNSRSTTRHVWFWCIPMIAVSSELAQSIHLIPGCFDQMDLITIILGTIFGYVAIDFNREIKEEHRYEA